MRTTVSSCWGSVPTASTGILYSGESCATSCHLFGWQSLNRWFNAPEDAEEGEKKGLIRVDAETANYCGKVEV